MTTTNALSNGEEVVVIIILIEILLCFCLAFSMRRIKIDLKGIDFRIFLLLLLLDDMDDLLVVVHNHLLKNIQPK